MPLSPPPERELLHSRDIVLRGYRRADGLYDIEAQLTDTKSYGSANRDRGYIHAGEPIHGMWLRLTVDERATYRGLRGGKRSYALCHLPIRGAEFRAPRRPADQAGLPEGGRQADRRHNGLHAPA